MVKVNAVILAGHGEDSRTLIYGEDKIFLKYENKTLAEKVAEAVSSSENIFDFRIVGCKDKLEKVLNGKYPIVDQVGSFVENAMAGYDSMIDNGRYTLFICGDLPYASAKAIDYLLNRINGD